MDVDFDFFDEPPKTTYEQKITLSKQNGREGSSRRADYTDSDSDDVIETRKTSKREKKTIKATLPVAEVHSDDSDVCESGRKGPTPRRKELSSISPDAHDENKTDGDTRQKCWDVDGSGDHIKKSNNRPSSQQPKSGKPEAEKKPRRHTSYSDDSYDTVSDSDHDTDSDVTDVSPLNSPHTMQKSRQTEESLSERARLSKPPVSPMTKDAKSTRSRPTSASKEPSLSARVEQLLNANKDSMDMKLLLEAVLEMEHQRSYDQSSRASSSSSKRPKLFKPVGPAPQPKKNYSFRNTQVREIDLENQRLMQNILASAKQGTKRRTQKPKEKPKRPPPRITTSSINRSREHQRIEQENQALLRRLQQAKPAKHVQRDHLLEDYNSAMLFGYSVAAAHELPAKKPPKRSPYTTPVQSASSSSLGSVDRPKSSVSGRRSRPTSASSAKSTPGRRQQPMFAPVTGPKAAWVDSW